MKSKKNKDQKLEKLIDLNKNVDLIFDADKKDKLNDL